jgi:hypothetical protein
MRCEPVVITTIYDIISSSPGQTRTMPQQTKRQASIHNSSHKPSTAASFESSVVIFLALSSTRRNRYKIKSRSYDFQAIPLVHKAFLQSTRKLQNRPSLRGPLMLPVARMM